MKSIASLIEQALVVATNRRAARSSHGLVCSSTSNPVGWVLPELGMAPQGPHSISREDRARHLYILGATGCGKTNLILQLLTRDLAEGRSVAVIDLRGDLVDRLLIRLAAVEPKIALDRVALLDLRDSHRIVGFNPLVGSGDPHARAYLLLDAVKAQSGSWGIQLEETLRNTLIALAEANLSLLELEPLLSDREFRSAVISRSVDPSVQAFFARFDDLSAERQLSWVLPVLNKVTPLIGIPRLRLLFGSPNTIDLRKVINRSGAIFLVALGVDRFHSAARLVGSLLIGSLECAIMNRVDLPESGRRPVNLYVDEFETMATEAFASIVAEGRRFGLSLTLSHQNLSQIPPNLRQVIRNNVQTQIYFQTGSIDARELRHELPSDDGEDVVKRLQTLPVGHAYFCCRPDDPLLVQFEECSEPQVNHEEVEAFTRSVHEAMGSLAANEAEEAVASRRGGIPAGQGTEHLPQLRPAVRHARKPCRSRRTVR